MAGRIQGGDKRNETHTGINTRRNKHYGNARRTQGKGLGSKQNEMKMKETDKHDMKIVDRHVNQMRSINNIPIE